MRKLIGLFIAMIAVSFTPSLQTSDHFAPLSKAGYAGDYIGEWEDLGPPGPAKFPMSLRIADDHTGKMFYANAGFKPFGSGTQDALTTMTLNGKTITSFAIDQSIAGYKDGCKATKTLTGHIEDDITIVLDTFVWTDCDGSREVKLRFTKQ